MRELFQAFLSGDDAAFGEIYREMNPRVSAYCFKLAPDVWQDIVQELWERVISLRAKHIDIESPLSFLFHVARNLTIDHFRRSVESRPILENDATTEEPAHDLEALVLESLERLAFDDREVLVLNIYSGYKFDEIAKIQGRSTEAVWQQASRARKKLRQLVVEDAKRLGIALPETTQKQKEGSIV